MSKKEIVTKTSSFKEKGQKLPSDALQQTEDIASSAKNLDKKGLQQFYTPESFARRLADVFIDSRFADKKGILAVDLQAGCGNLIVPFLDTNPAIPQFHSRAIGNEIDSHNIPKVNDDRIEFYNADFPALAKYLHEIQFRASLFALNPPFSLRWRDSITDKEVESQDFTLKYAIEHLTLYGAGYMISNRGFAEKLITLNKYSEVKSHIPVILYVKNLFKESNASVESAVTFFLSGPVGRPPATLECDYLDKSEELDRVFTEVKTKIGYTNVYQHPAFIQEQMDKYFKAYSEYKMDRTNKYHIDYKSGLIKFFLTGFKQEMIVKKLNNDQQQSISIAKNKNPNYFVFNTKVRDDIIDLINDGFFTCSPEAFDKLTKSDATQDLIMTPYRQLMPQQRLGYLTDYTKIKCINGFEKDGYNYISGQSYAIVTSTKISQVEFEEQRERVEHGIRQDVWVNFRKTKKALCIRIEHTDGGHSFELSETPEDIGFIIDHFEVPNPGDLATKFPEELAKIEERLRSPEFSVFTLKDYQIYDLARCAMKSAAILSWSQGLGKTRGALAWSKLRDSKKCLIVCPQDLKGQWKEEAEKFGIELQDITDWNSVQHAVRSKTGYFITHYEFLALKDVIRESVPVIKCAEQIEYVGYAPNELRYNKETKRYEEKEVDQEVRIFRGTPNNMFSALHITGHEMADPGVLEAIGAFPELMEYWSEAEDNGECKRLRQVTSKERLVTKQFKGYSVFLKQAFKNGSIIVDEGVKIKTKESLRGVSVRRLQSKNKLLLSGAPIKNYFVDLYYLFGWLYGYNTPRFPYEYKDREKFLNDFGTFAKEILPPSEEKKKPKQPRLLPEINNLSLFWKLLAPCIVRRTKEESGENLVAKSIHRIGVEFSQKQFEQYSWWANTDNFWEWFLATHPEYKKKPMLLSAKIAGQLWKLRFISTAPTSISVSSRDTYWNDSPYTNKMLTTLKLVDDIMKRGEQVVIFSNLQDNLSQLKTMFGFKAMIANGTVNPNRRKDIISQFKKGYFPILLAGIEAINLGHDIPQCNNLIMTDYVWEHSTTRQAYDRIHRLTSLKDVNIYLVYVEGSYDQVMVELIDKKGMASDLALDGTLQDQDELKVDFRQLLKDSLALFKKKQKANQSYIDEDDIRVEAHKILSNMFQGSSVSIGSSDLAQVNATRRTKIVELTQKITATAKQRKKDLDESLSLFGT